MKRLLLTDKEVAAILGMSPSTLSRKVRSHGKKWKVARAILTIPGMRRWRTSILADELGMTEQELIDSAN